MESTATMKRIVSRQYSMGSIKKPGSLLSFRRQSSMDNSKESPGTSGSGKRFTFGRQSSLDPNQRTSVSVRDAGLAVPDNLDATMHLLFMACQGDVDGVEELLMDEAVDVNSIDLDGRTALHIAACEGNLEVVSLLISMNANIDARDRWGSTAAADAKHYGNIDVYNCLRSRGALVPKTRKTPMSVTNPKEVPEYEMNPAELQIRKGDGITAGTYQVAKWNGTKVAVKILDKGSYSDQDIINAFKHELTLLEKVRHPNVVQFVGAVTQNIPMMIVSEYHPKGDLGNYLQKKGRLQCHKALRFALDIARGMNYLHGCKPDPIIHCDLKPKNILLDSGGQLKVAGFGLIRMPKVSSYKVKLANHASDIDNSSLYMAPEVYRNQAFDRSVDAFSFGLILYEELRGSNYCWRHRMIDGAHAFHPKAPEDAAKIICLEGLRPTFKTKTKGSELKELIEECWNREPLARPTFAEIVVRLDKIYSNCTKPAKWKENFKLPWK